MSDEARPDLKESFVWGLDVDDADPDYRSGRPLAGPNQWPAGLPRMRATFMRYFEECNGLGKLLLRAFAAVSTLSRTISSEPSKSRSPAAR